MFRRGWALALLGVAGLAVSACTDQPRQQQAVIVPTQSCDTQFRVENRSSATVQTLQFSHSSQSGWGVDQLGQDVLPPGRAKLYRAANTGNYDFRITWANGRAAELLRINVCRASRIIVTDRGLVAS
jgi:hypothetical protein